MLGQKCFNLQQFNDIKLNRTNKGMKKNAMLVVIVMMMVELASPQCVVNQAGCTACNGAATQCTACLINYSFFTGVCTACGSGFYAAAGQAPSCNNCLGNNCHTCGAAQTTACQTCKANYGYYASACHLCTGGTTGALGNSVACVTPSSSSSGGSTSTHSSANPDNRLGIIIGSTIGGAVLIVAASLIIYFCCIKQTKQILQVASEVNSTAFSGNVNGKDMIKLQEIDSSNVIKATKQ